MIRRIHTLSCLGFLTFCLILCPAQAAVPVQFAEDFTSTTYQDAINTTADWNTVDGELKLFPFTTSLIGACDTPGYPDGLSVCGDYAFVADYLGLQIIDISDPANPTLVGSHPTAGIARDVTVAGDYAFLAAGGAGLQVFDISDPTNPVLAGYYDTPGDAFGVTVTGDLAFVADFASGLQVIDISDPVNPALLGSCLLYSYANSVAVAGDYAFVANDYGGLKVVDISDPTNPTLAGTFDTPGNALGVVVLGDYAFVADYSSGLQVLDISDPPNPTFLGSCNTPGSGWDVTVSGDFAYLTDGNMGLQKIDISDPTNPTILETFTAPYAYLGVVIAGNHAYVTDYSFGLQVIEIAQPTKPVLIGSSNIPGNSLDIAVSGDYAFVAGFSSGLQVMDISDPSNPSFLGSVFTPGQAYGVTVSGDCAFVADSGAGLQVIDISDPTNPTLLGVCSTPDLAKDVVVSGDFAFVADSSSGLQVINISAPDAPTIQGNYNTSSLALGVAVSGNLAFVADYLAGLLVIDISNPASPALLGDYNTLGSALDVAVSGDYAFVADSGNGLQIIDVSDPANPALIGSYNTPYAASGVTISGDYAFVADMLGGLQVIDISDPTNPMPWGNCISSGSAQDVAISGEYAYLAGGIDGLQVIMVFQSEFDVTTNAGRSLLVDGPYDTILSARLTTSQTESVTWELSAEGGSSWQEFAPNGNWNRMTVPGTDLMWRSTHNYTTPGVNPAVSNLTLEWLYAFAPITSITDVPDDQGGLVNVAIKRSAYDSAAEIALPVNGYNIYRRVDYASLAAKGMELSPAKNQEILLTPSGAEAWPVPGEKIVTSGDEFFVVGSSASSATSAFPPGTWKLISSAFANQSDTYTLEATTFADSTTSGIDWSVYLATTHTSTASVWFISLPDSGYSLDNLAPEMPTAITAAYLADGVTLGWDDAPENDFQYYRVYRDTDPGFVPSAENLVQEIATSTWIDPTASPWGFEYKITTLDYVGNESEAGSPGSVSGVNDEMLPVRTALLGATPNPFNPSTKLFFEMAKPGHVRLKVYDTAGRLVASLLDEHRDTGSHEVVWDGRDGTGRMSGAGVYLYRLESNGTIESKRMTLLK